MKFFLFAEQQQRRDRRHQQRGFVVMSVLAFILLGAALTLLLVEESGERLNATAAQAERRTLSYVTEAGMAHALWQLRQNSTCNNYVAVPATIFAGHNYRASVSPTSGSPVSVVASGTLAGGAIGTRVRSEVATYSTPVVLTLQTDSGDKDSFIEEDDGHQDHNKADERTIEVDSETGKNLRGLIEFDLSEIPASAHVLSATLTLDISKSDGAADAVEAHRIAAAWEEDEVTWLERSNGNNWSSEGGDFDSSIASSFVVAAKGSATFDLQALTQDWVSGRYPNYGVMLLTPSSAGGQTKEFTSSDFPAATKHPQLTVTYACECGQVCGGVDSLLAHWKLDESKGNVAKDSIGNHEGSLEGDPSWQTGKVDGALGFDGKDDLINVGRILEDGTPALTIAAWVYKRDGADSRVVTKSSSTSRDDHVYSLGVSNRTIRIRLTTDNHDGNADFDGGQISLNQWTHVAFSYDGVDLRIYRNGSETAVYPLEGDIVSSKLDTVIGNVNTDDSRYWNGLLDDIRLYDEALSAEDIATLAGRGPTELVAHWTLDDGDGSMATDLTGNHDGKLQGGPAWTTTGLDGSLRLDGNNDYIDVGNFDVIGNGITLSGWMNADRLADDGRVISKASSINAPDAWWQLGFSDVGADWFMRLRIKAGGSTTTYTDPSTPLVENQWYFVAGSYDNESGEMRHYINGTAVSSRSHGSGGPLDTSSAINVWVGANGDPTRFFEGTLDDVRIYNGALTPTEISDLEDSGADAHTPAYTETFADWGAERADAWESFDLGALGVPAGAVAEITIENTSINRELRAGIRAVGSSLDRRLQLHEAESGGADTVTLNVQVDGNARIEHYAEREVDIRFTLLGYWNSGTYVERANTFQSGADKSWSSQSLAVHDVPANSVVDLALINLSTSSEQEAGSRFPGSLTERRVKLQEAESGGQDIVSMATQTSRDASSTIEVFVQDSDEVEFTLLGYWSVPPGTFTETFLQIPGSPSSNGTWEALDLGSVDVPAYSVVQMALANGEDGSEADLGIRQLSSTHERLLSPHEAEAGGDDFSTLHVKSDGDATVEWFDSDTGDDHRFYVLGWWILSP